MSFSSRRTLESGMGVRMVFNKDPALACPEGIVKASIHLGQLTRNMGALSVWKIDDFFEALDHEGQDGRLLGNDFPVFIANLDGAQTKSATINSYRAYYIQATIRLGYCTNYRNSKNNPEAGFNFQHTPLQHRADAVDTCLALAGFALHPSQYGLPSLPTAGLDKLLLDRVIDE
jgi:hypothetical protein